MDPGQERLSDWQTRLTAGEWVSSSLQQLLLLRETKETIRNHLLEGPGIVKSARFKSNASVCSFLCCLLRVSGPNPMIQAHPVTPCQHGKWISAYFGAHQTYDRMVCKLPLPSGSLGLFSQQERSGWVLRCGDESHSPFGLCFRSELISVRWDDGGPGARFGSSHTEPLRRYDWRPIGFG